MIFPVKTFSKYVVRLTFCAWNNCKKLWTCSNLMYVVSFCFCEWMFKSVAKFRYLWLITNKNCICEKFITVGEILHMLCTIQFRSFVSQFSLRYVGSNTYKFSFTCCVVCRLWCCWKSRDCWCCGECLNLSRRKWQEDRGCVPLLGYYGSWDGVVCIVSWLWAGWSVIWILVPAGCRSYPAFCAVGTGSFFPWR